MASILYKLEPIYRYFPEVKGPKRHVSFREKLSWVGIALLLFFIMGQVVPLGATKANTQLETLQIVFASQLGTLMSIGIGPIVTASIILQLLVGSKIIDLDLSNPEDKGVFQGTQKLLVLVVALFEAFMFANVGAIPIVNKTFETVFFVAIQIAFASVILMFLDEIVSKWGIGSGIGLFIAAGVSQRIMTRSMSFISEGGGTLPGIIPEFVNQLSQGNLELLILFPLLATVVVFLLVVYFESLKIEIPLSYGRFGIGARYPLKFFYTSNIPVILAAAVLANVTIFANVFAGAGLPILGQVDSQNRIINNPSEGGVGFWITQGDLYGILQFKNLERLTNPTTLLHLFTYSLTFILLCVMFGTFWVMMSGMDAETVSDQMESSGLQIPGFRADKRVIRRVLDRYIPQLTVVSAVSVGLLAVVADLTGALGSGTGILLTVGILYRMYEEVKKEQLNDMNPALRKLMGGSR